MIEDELAGKGYSIPVIGYVPEQELFSLESRHLGLVMPEEVEGLRRRLHKAGELLSGTVDFDLLLEIAENAPELEGQLPEQRSASEKVKIAVARDEAFCFYYQDNLELLKQLGCELLFFSPLHEEKVPDDAQGMLLGGGYPELYAKQLAANRKMCDSVKEKIHSGLPCIAECGGFLYLHEMLEGKDGNSYPMAGVIAGNAFRTDRLGRFGYLSLQAEADGAFLRKGEVLRGHEFHYWDSTENGTDCLAVKPQGNRSWKCVHMEGTLFAGFPHIHFYSNPVFAKRFVRACRERVKCFYNRE